VIRNEIYKAEKVTDLLPKLSEVIATWPLYREFKYEAKHPEFPIFPGMVSAYAMLPQTIELFCDNGRCQKQQSWQLSQGGDGGPCEAGHAASLSSLASGKAWRPAPAKVVRTSVFEVRGL